MVRFLWWLIFLVPRVNASCLDNAVPSAQRKVLVNANGETYPVGFYQCSWAASAAANSLAATLVKEVLGYNTTSNSDLGLSVHGGTPHPSHWGALVFKPMVLGDLHDLGQPQSWDYI